MLQPDVCGFTCPLAAVFPPDVECAATKSVHQTWSIIQVFVLLVQPSMAKAQQLWASSLFAFSVFNPVECHVAVADHVLSSRSCSVLDAVFRLIGLGRHQGWRATVRVCCECHLTCCSVYCRSDCTFERVRELQARSLYDHLASSSRCVQRGHRVLVKKTESDSLG